MQPNSALRFAPAFLPARIQLSRAMMDANSAKDALGILDAAPNEQKLILAYVIQRNWVLLGLNDQTEARNGDLAFQDEERTMPWPAS